VEEIPSAIKSEQFDRVLSAGSIFWS